MKKITALLVGLMLVPAVLAADEKKDEQKADEQKQETAAPAKDKSWFETTLKGLKSRVSRKFHSASVKPSAVAAVRGSEMDQDAMAPDWKGSVSEKSAEQLNKEHKAVADAFEKIVAGNTEGGRKDLETFITSYPNSPLKETVKEALAKLQPKEETAKSEPAAEPAKDVKKEEPKEETKKESVPEKTDK